jgi:hypothetical protein
MIGFSPTQDIQRNYLKLLSVTLTGGVDVPLPMDKLASHVPPFGTQEYVPHSLPL